MTNYASYANRSARVSGDFGNAMARRYFGDDIVDSLPCYVRGKNKGKPKGDIEWIKVSRGGWSSDGVENRVGKVLCARLVIRPFRGGHVDRFADYSIDGWNHFAKFPDSCDYRDAPNYRFFNGREGSVNYRFVGDRSAKRAEYDDYAAESRACGYEVEPFDEWLGEASAKARAYARLPSADNWDFY